MAGSEMKVTGLLPGEKYHFTVATVSEDDQESPNVEASIKTGTVLCTQTFNFWSFMPINFLALVGAVEQ